MVPATTSVCPVWPPVPLPVVVLLLSTVAPCLISTMNWSLALMRPLDAIVLCRLIFGVPGAANACGSA